MEHLGVFEQSSSCVFIFHWPTQLVCGVGVWWLSPPSALAPNYREHGDGRTRTSTV